MIWYFTWSKFLLLFKCDLKCATVVSIFRRVCVIKADPQMIIKSRKPPHLSIPVPIIDFSLCQWTKYVI